MTPASLPPDASPEFRRGWVACLRALASERRRLADEGVPRAGRNMGQRFHAIELRIEADRFGKMADDAERESS